MILPAQSNALADHRHRITDDWIEDGVLSGGKLADGTVDTDQLAADAVTGAKLEDDAVDSEHIADDAILTNHYADSSIDSLGFFATTMRPTFVGSSAPGSPVEGQGWYDTDDETVKWYDGTNWRRTRTVYLDSGTSDFVFAAVGGVNQTVNFNVTFAAAPVVLTSWQAGTGGRFMSGLTGAPGTTSFPGRVAADDAASFSGTVVMHWIALGVVNG